MKKPEVYLKEYCQRLSDESLKFLNQRLGQRLSGDLAEVLDFLGNVKEIDRWLSSAQSCDGLYDMLDLVHASVTKECERCERRYNAA
jgi:hypothetical protein